RGRARNAYLLAEERPHTGLERIPGSRRTKARSTPQQWADDRIVAELCRGLVQVEVEARDTTRAGDDVDQLLPVRQVCAQHEMVVAAAEELEHSGVAVDHDRAPVGVRRDGPDTRDRTGGAAGGAD